MEETHKEHAEPVAEPVPETGSDDLDLIDKVVLGIGALGSAILAVGVGILGLKVAFFVLRKLAEG